MAERVRGPLQKFRSDKGKGFIKDPNNATGSGILLNISQVEGNKIPTVGDIIEFEIEMGQNGPQAVRARVVTGEHFSPTPAARATALEATAGQVPAAPYTFVPVALTETVAGLERRVRAGESFPVPGHDGKNASDRCSGELNLTITAHTPLLVGAARYNVDLPEQSPFAPKTTENDGPDGKPTRSRNLLEPWRLPDGRVVLAGSSIKGMIRHHLGALLNAPMERVYEQYFSYRPNLEVRGAAGTYQFREAVIEQSPDTAGRGLEVRLLAPGRQAIYVRENALAKLGVSVGGRVRAGNPIFGVQFDSRPRARRLMAARPRDSWTANKDYVLAPYCGGMTGKVDASGESVLTRLHSASGGQGTRLYTAVLVPTGGRTVRVSKQVVLEYQQTYRELADMEHGHCSSRNPIIGSGEKNQKKASKALSVAARLGRLAEGTLIYVEVDTNQEVVSLGHHFRYRWGYRDTVRRLDRANTNRVRPELDVTKIERQWASNPQDEPAALSPVRAMFGYAADEKIHGNCFGGNYSRLAGRIMVNHAVEVVDEGDPKEPHRFLRMRESCVLPLKELGAPRASAVEFYVRQREEENKRGCVTTYGDLSIAPDSELAGRKFYRHQPLAASDQSCYLATDDEGLRNKRATLARFVSAPGARFRCTLRFRDLSEQELGALLFVLGIQNADDYLGNNAGRGSGGGPPAYALTLGYARPLGWGSVTTEVDAVHLINCSSANSSKKTHGQPGVFISTMEDLSQWQRKYVNAFREAGAELAPNLTACLAAWRFRGRGKAEYPTATNGVETAIFHYHTGLRRAHSKNRRSDAGSEEARELKKKLAIVRPAYSPDKRDDRED